MKCFAAAVLVSFFSLPALAEDAQKGSFYNPETVTQSEVSRRISSILKAIKIEKVNCVYDNIRKGPVCFFKDDDYYFITGGHWNLVKLEEIEPFLKRTCAKFSEKMPKECVFDVTVIPSIEVIGGGTTRINGEEHEGFELMSSDSILLDWDAAKGARNPSKR